MNIQKQFIKYNFTPNTIRKIQYIVIHDTGDKGATAQNEHDYFAGGDRQASADFFVDDKNIIQIVDYTKGYSWHCGDGHGKNGITNTNSIGIEICLIDGKQDIIISNTIELVQYLMKQLNIDINHVVRHFDASGKFCPGSFIANNWTKWSEFKARLLGCSDIQNKPLIRTLHVGDKGVDVKVLQILLNRILKPVPQYKIAENGEYTAAFAEVVKKFQKKYGLTVDGIAGTNTFIKVKELLSK